MSWQSYSHLCIDGNFSKMKTAFLLSYVVNLQNFPYIMNDLIDRKSFYLKVLLFTVKALTKQKNL